MNVQAARAIIAFCLCAGGWLTTLGRWAHRIAERLLQTAGRLLKELKGRAQ